MSDVVEVALEALRNDANDRWDKTADALDEAHSTAKGLKCTTEFSFMGEALGVTEKYNKYQELLATLAKEGKEHSAEVADELRAAADTYEQEEEDGVHKMNNVW